MPKYRVRAVLKFEIENEKELTKEQIEEGQKEGYTFLVEDMGIDPSEIESVTFKKVKEE